MATSRQVYEYLVYKGSGHAESTREEAAIIKDELDLDTQIRTIQRYIQRYRKGEIPEYVEEMIQEKQKGDRPSGDDSEVDPEQRAQRETPDETTFWSSFTGDGAIPDPEGDAYHVHVPGKGPKTVPGDTYRAMKERYSNWEGDWDTITEICREFGISYKDFEKFKRAAGWTHHTSPWPDDELLDRDTGDLLDDLARRKERKVHHEWQKKQRRDDARDAEKWRKFDKGVIEPLYKRISQTPIKGPIETAPVEERAPYYFMPHPVDGHLDQKNADGTGFEENRKRWLGCLRQNIARAKRLGRPPRRTIIDLGQDLTNIDSMYKTTAAGTPQDQDLMGNDAVQQPFDVGVEAIELCRELDAPVEVKVIPGNHDWRTMVAYYWGLKKHYQFHDANDVTFTGGAEKMQFGRYGNNLCVWLHGENLSGGETKQNWNLSSQILHNATHLLDEDISHFYALMGHNHHILEKDDGVHTLQGGSTAKTDEWHRVNQYETSKACQTAYILDESGGQTVRFTSYPE